MQKLVYYISVVLLILTACRDENIVENIETSETNSLSEFIASNNYINEIDLIACAGGSALGSISDQLFPISVFLLPKDNVSNINYWESKSVDVNPDDNNIYLSNQLSSISLLNGFLRRFLLTDITEEKWCKVSYTRNDTIFISNAIRLKYPNIKTEFNNKLLTISQTTTFNPLFNWADGTVNQNEIYFQVVQDSLGQVLSATYTNDKYYKYGDLSNVVLNVTPNETPIDLQNNQTYKFVLMGVSIDNWVNLYFEKEFEVFVN